MKLRTPFLLLAALVAVCLPSCSAAIPAPVTPADPTSVWDALLERTPYPYSTAVPSPERTSLDGLFHRLGSGPASRGPCRRCPPYPPVGGEWRLQLDRGVFRVYHSDTSWATVGSFHLHDDLVHFFNDPHCLDETGIYTWTHNGGQLSLTVVRDACAQDLRARALSGTPWIRD